MYAENIKRNSRLRYGKNFCRIGLQENISQRHTRIQEKQVDISTSGKRALSYPYTDQKGIKLAAGETLTVSCDDTYEVQNYYVIIPGNTDLQYTTVMHNGNPWMVVDPDAGGSTSTETPFDKANVSYTAEEECYIALMIRRKANNNDFDSEELSALSSHVVCKINP